MLHNAWRRKSYGEIPALRGVDLDVSAGEIVSLLGPNGPARRPPCRSSQGSAWRTRAPWRSTGTTCSTGPPRCAGRSVWRRRTSGLYPVVSVRRNLRLSGELAGLRGADLTCRIDEVAEALDITDPLDRQAGKNVETRGHVLDLVRQLADEGSAVLYSTHYLAEVETRARAPRSSTRAG